MNRRVFLLGIFGLPLLATAAPEKITVWDHDRKRFDDEDALRKMLLLDLEDMDIHKQLGLNLARVKAEDKLYKAIQEDRRW